MPDSRSNATIAYKRQRQQLHAEIHVSKLPAEIIHHHAEQRPGLRMKYSPLNSPRRCRYSREYRNETATVP
jgi:hypothetical protein